MGGRSRERNVTELGPGQADRSRLERLDGLADALAERTQQLRTRLEAVLVEVVARAPAGAEDEVALEVGVLAQCEPQLVVRQGVWAWRRISRALGSRRSAPGEPFVSESIEPSSK